MNKYIIDCKHYPTDRCNVSGSICLFNFSGGLGCRNIKIDWVKVITQREHITNIREDRGQYG